MAASDVAQPATTTPAFLRDQHAAGTAITSRALDLPGWCHAVIATSERLHGASEERRVLPTPYHARRIVEQLESRIVNVDQATRGTVVPDQRTAQEDVVHSSEPPD
jgi:hypothetical protein